MATEIGTQTAALRDFDLREHLRRDPCSFEFFQAVSLLQRLSPSASPVGGFPRSPGEEAVHFRVHPRLAFPASQIQKLEMREQTVAEMTVNFMGLTGPSGVLPYPYSELILARAKEKDESLADFLNIFNNRLIALFYRAWQKARFPVTYSLEGRDYFTQYLFHLIGLGTPGLRNRQHLEDDALLHYVSLVSMQTRSAAALEQIIGDYFETPVEIEQFTGAWYALDPRTQSVMTGDESPGSQLGTGAIVGDAVWNCQARARIRIGPLTLRRYREFLPDGSAYAALRSLVRLYSNNTLDFDLQLVLQRKEVLGVELDFDSPGAARLGWTSWARNAQICADPDDTILAL